MKKQKILMLVLAIAAAVLILLWFFVIEPYIINAPAEFVEMGDYEMAQNTDGTVVLRRGDETITLNSGEYVAEWSDGSKTLVYDGTIQEILEGEIIEGNRVLLFPHTERENMQSVEIYNTHGKYTVCRNGEGSFVLSGFEEVEIDPTALSSIVVGGGYALTMQRIADHAEDLSEYGLDESQDPAWYKLTNLQGESWKVYIGKKIVSGAAYYVRSEGSDSVYAISTSLIDALLLPKETIVSKQLTTTISSTQIAGVSNFAIMHGDEKYVAIKMISEEERDELGLTIVYQMTAPSGYNVNSSTYTEALENFVEFTATEILSVGITNARLEKYGLKDAPYTVYFEINGEENLLYVSEKTPEGTRYVASVTKDIIGVYDATEFDFLELDLIHWVDQSIFMVNINEVGTIKIESDRVNETFTLEGEAQELVVTTSGGIKPDVSNFRQFYKTLLGSNIQGYSELSEEEIAEYAKGEPELTFTYITRAGRVTEYKFYTISERRTICLINGEGGEFHYLYTHVNKISSDCIKIINGETVDSEDRS